MFGGSVHKIVKINQLQISKYQQYIINLPQNISILYNYYFFASKIQQIMTESSSTSDRYLTVKKRLPDVQEMKKAILAQVDVTYDDLKVMSIQQITNFYKELIQGTTQENMAKLTATGAPPQQQKSKSNQIISLNVCQKKSQISTTRRSQQENQKLKVNPKNISSNQKQIDKKVPDLQNKTNIQVNGQLYYQPKYLTKASYKLSNKRMAILCGPYLESVSDKKQAVLSAYNPSIAETIKALKLHQIQQTYERLRVPQKKQNLYLKLKKQIEPKQFIIYAPCQQIKGGTNFFIKAQKLQDFNYKPNSVSQNQQKSNNNSHGQEQLQSEAAQDQFFDEFYKGNQKDNQKSDKRQQKTKNQPSIRETIEFAKRKNKIQKSAQTQKIKNSNKKTKVQIRIIRHIQQIEEQDDEEVKPTIRERQSDQNDQFQQLHQNAPYKMNYSQIIKSLLEPGNSPSIEIMNLIKNLKILTQQFEQRYLEQFSSNWQFFNN